MTDFKKAVRRAVVVLALLPAAAHASCPYTNGPLVLSKIRLGDPGATWVACVNASLDLLSGMAPSNSTSSWATFGKVSVSTISGNGAPIYISSAVVVAANMSLTMTGANGYVVSGTSITTSGGFFGNGSGLTSLTGANVTGTVPSATSATTATNLAAGAVGQHPYQTAAGATAFLPAMGAAGIIVGNGTSLSPSTATLTGTANQVTVTQGVSAVTLSLPQSINSGATPTFTGTNFTGIPESGVTSLTTDLAARVLKAGDTMTGKLNGTDLSLTYGATAATMTVTQNLTASSVTATATGPTQYSLETSSGILIDAGSIVNNGSGGEVVKYGVLAGTGAFTKGLIAGTSSFPLPSSLVFLSTGAGALFSPMSAAEMNALVNPSSGTIVYNTGTNAYNFYNGTAWTAIGSGSGGATASLASAYTNPTGVTAQTTIGVCQFAASTATWTQGNNKALLCYSGGGSPGGNSSTLIAAILLDGVVVSSVTSYNAGNNSNLSQCYLTTTALSAGSHSACMSFANNGAFNTTIGPAVSGNGGSQLSVVEIASVGAGYSVPGSSFTYIPGAVVTAGTLGTCVISTVSWFGSGAPTDIVFNGSVSNNSTQESALSFLIDGAFVSPMSASIAAITPSPVSTTCGDANFKVRVTGLAAGTHYACLTAATNSGVNLTIVGQSTKCPYQSTWYNASQFGAQEIRTTAGTGDLGSNTNANTTGNWTFNGNVTLAGAANTPVMVSSYDFVMSDGVTSKSTITINASDFGGVDFSSQSWRVHIVATSTNTVHYMLYFNNDLATFNANQYKNNSFLFSAGTTPGGLTNRGCLLDQGASGYQVQAGASFVSDFDFETVIGSSSTIIGTAVGRYNSVSVAVGQLSRSVNDCYLFEGSGKPTKISISADTLSDSQAVPTVTGHMTGYHVELWRVGSKHP